MKLPNSKTEKGKVFEEMAIRFLRKNGFEILTKNHQVSHKEIDIICKKDGIIHFVEVKGRTSNAFGEITETITNKKKRNLIVAATNWMAKNSTEDIDWQIDFLGIEMQKEGKITFLENAINQL